MDLMTSAPQRRASDWPVVGTAEPVKPLTVEPLKGKKHDSGKLRWSLFPVRTLKEVLKVLEFGARTYGEENWKHVPEARTRYYNALKRHVEDWWEGETRDPDTGAHPLAHAVCCALFLIWLDWNSNAKPSQQTQGNDATSQGNLSEKPSDKV